MGNYAKNSGTLFWNSWKLVYLTTARESLKMPIQGNLKPRIRKFSDFKPLAWKIALKSGKLNRGFCFWKLCFHSFSQKRAIWEIAKTILELESSFLLLTLCGSFEIETDGSLWSWYSYYKVEVRIKIEWKKICESWKVEEVEMVRKNSKIDKQGGTY